MLRHRHLRHGQSGTKKEDVSRTYQGFDGYTPIAAYLGNEGWNIGLELRPGSKHSASETNYFYERLFPRVERLVKADQPVLLRGDSGFDSAELLFAKMQEKDRLAAKGRTFNFICKWNPRTQDKAAWVNQAEAANAFTEARPGKRVAFLSQEVARVHDGVHRNFRLITQITERTSDKTGQSCLIDRDGHALDAQIELEGWWTTLDKPIDEVNDLYKHHGMHEQFHSEFKTDLDLERLPSGKFNTNDTILHLAAFAYNCLRLLGQVGLTGAITPIRHPAKRRRIRTVLQEIMYRAAKFSAHARRLILDFGRHVVAHVQVFVAVQNWLRPATG